MRRYGKAQDEGPAEGEQEPEPHGRVDAYLTIDTPTGPYRMKTTKATQEKADAVRGDPFEALFVIAALGGPRPAELLALRWEDFDESVSHLAGGELDWNEPKSEMGLRVLPLAERGLLSERRHAALEQCVASGRYGGREDFARSSSHGSTIRSAPTAVTPCSGAGTTSRTGPD
jgi:integrase